MSGQTNRTMKKVRELMKVEEVPAELMTQCLQTGIYELSKTHTFLSNVLQCLNIYYTHMIERAGVAYNADNKRWDLMINPHFFCRKINGAQRKAILLHELAHLTNKHPFRVPFIKMGEHKRQLMNVGADLAINQYIRDLPKGCQQCPPREAQMAGAECQNPLCPGGCCFIEDYHDVDEKTGKQTPWKTQQTMEFYYEKLLERFKDINDKCENCGKSMGQGAPTDGSGKGDGEGQPQDGKCPHCGHQHSGGKLPKEYDSHNWSDNVEESEMLDATDELMQRAMVKSGLSYDQLPGSIQDLLADIKARKAELNYKAIIMSALKRHAAGHDRKHTWSRKSKRYGELAPGTCISELPRLRLFLDSSGSISIEELNEFLGIVDDFLKVGARKCEVCFFHTSLYLKQPYKRGDRFDRKKVQSGGTDLRDCFKYMVETPSDLNLFITDGCYGDVEYEKMLRPNQKLSQTLFIISREGAADHPLKRLPTIKIPQSSKRKQ